MLRVKTLFDELLGLIGRHKFVCAISALILGLPIILAMTPLMLVLTIMWFWVGLKEAGSRK